MGRAPHHSGDHKRWRAWYVARYIPGVTRCAIGGEVLTQHPRLLDLAHDDANPGRYLGLACQSHNRGSHRDSPRSKGKPHPWSTAYKIMKQEQRQSTDDDREVERRSRIEDREQQRTRRMIIIADEDQEEL